MVLAPNSQHSFDHRNATSHKHLQKIMESWNHKGWKRPQESLSPSINPSLPGPQVNHIPKHHINTFFEDF